MVQQRVIVLASASPRRSELITQLGIEYVCAPSDVDERALTYKAPREFAVKAAYAKACAVEPAFPESIIVAADTVVVLGGVVYGKPADAAEARRMLHALSGQTHSVITGIAVKESGKSALLDAEETYVRFRDLSEGEITEYVASGEPLDKAGAYAIQGLGGKLVDAIDGDYFNVVGLPLARLVRMLGMFVDVSQAESRLARMQPFRAGARLIFLPRALALFRTW